jgi:hypothetical protein
MNMKFAALLLSLAIVAASCTTSTTPDNTITTSMPRVGSTYTFESYDTDTNGAVVAGSDTTHVDAVVASGIVFDDERDVWVVKGSNSDSSFYSVDMYNDVIIRGSSWDAWFDQVWIRMPITSGVSSNVFNTDRATINGIVVETTRRITSERVSEEQVTVSGTQIRTFKVKITVSRVVTQNGTVVSDYSTFHYYWFAPSLGVTVRIETPSQIIFGKKMNGAIEMLKSYTLK